VNIITIARATGTAITYIVSNITHTPCRDRCGIVLHTRARDLASRTCSIDCAHQMSEHGRARAARTHARWLHAVKTRELQEVERGKREAGQCNLCKRGILAMCVCKGAHKRTHEFGVETAPAVAHTRKKMPQTRNPQPPTACFAHFERGPKSRKYLAKRDHHLAMHECQTVEIGSSWVIPNATAGHNIKTNNRAVARDAHYQSATQNDRQAGRSRNLPSLSQPQIG
jgi:hypothetical protein